MTVKWLLEQDVFQENLERYRTEIARQGMECKMWHYVPFDDAEKFLNLYPEATDCVVVYGSLQFGQAVRHAARWVPGVWLNLPQLDCAYYYPRLGSYLLNRNYVMLPFGDLTRRKKWLLGHVGVAGRVFIRPSGGVKAFSGKVVTAETWEKDIRLLGFYDVPPEELVVVSEPVNIEQEWRLVIGGVTGEPQQVIAASGYKEQTTRLESTPGAPPEVLAFAETILATTDYHPDPVWTLDICRTCGGDLRVLEVGSFSCADLYACNPETVVREVSLIALGTWEAAKS